jgi:hypothetical protein
VKFWGREGKMTRKGGDGEFVEKKGFPCFFFCFSKERESSHLLTIVCIHYYYVIIGHHIPFAINTGPKVGGGGDPIQLENRVKKIHK